MGSALPPQPPPVFGAEEKDALRASLLLQALPLSAAQGALRATLRRPSLPSEGFSPGPQTSVHGEGCQISPLPPPCPVQPLFCGHCTPWPGSCSWLSCPSARPPPNQHAAGAGPPPRTVRGLSRDTLPPGHLFRAVTDAPGLPTWASARRPQRPQQPPPARGCQGRRVGWVDLLLLLPESLSSLSPTPTSPTSARSELLCWVVWLVGDFRDWMVTSKFASQLTRQQHCRAERAAEGGQAAARTARTELSRCPRQDESVMGV